MPRKVTSTLKSFEDVDQALLKLAKAQTLIQHEEAVMNDAAQRLRDAFDKSTADARQQKAALEADIEAYCIENKDEFEAKKSRELVHGIVAFRTAPPAVKLLNRKYNWKTALELLRKLRLAKYIRTTYEVDKEALLTANAAEEITDEKLAACGLKIDQGETFSIDIKWDAVKE
jgi:phage host-nuclease inhibitor protein Gam